MPGKTVRTFSLQFCPVNISTLPALTGFAEGDALTLEFPNDDWEVQESSDGEVIFIQKHNSTMDGMIRLGQGNSLISLMRQLHQASLDAGGISYQFSAKSLKSPDEAITGRLMFKKHAPFKWGDTAQPAEFPFSLVVTMLAGGDITPT